MMAVLQVDDIRRLSDLHPKPEGIGYQYGTAGFRTSCVLMTTVGSTDLNLIYQGQDSGLGAHESGDSSGLEE